MLTNGKDGKNRPKIKLMFVYGALRSGTTMLRLMLNQQPSLCCPGESDFLFDYLTIDGGEVLIDLEALQRDRIFQANLGTVEDLGDPMNTLMLMLQRLGAGEGITLVLMLHRGIGKAAQLFPDQPIIHMLRDPRDVARSSIGMGWAGNVYHGASHWIDTEAEWDSVAPEVASRQIFDFKFETLISQPEKTLQALCAFSNVPWDDTMLAYDEHTTYSQPNIRLIEQWKHKLSTREVGLVEGRVDQMLVAKGYELSGNKVIVPGIYYAALLHLHNKMLVWRHRIARYGLLDPLCVTLAARLGLPQLGYRAQARMNAKLTNYLK